MVTSKCISVGALKQVTTVLTIILFILVPRAVSNDECPLYGSPHLHITRSPPGGVLVDRCAAEQQVYQATMCG